MALTPSELDEILFEESDLTEETSRTYGFNPVTGEFTGGMVDGREALMQFIKKALLTPRFKHLIYDDQYGSELDSLLGENMTIEYLQTEVPRMVRETLLYDGRIEDVKDITLEKVGDTVNIQFTVITAEGIIMNEEVSI